MGARAEAEEYEALAARGVLRDRTLADATLALLHRGDVVAVHSCGTTHTGPLVHAVADLVVVGTPNGHVDVHLGVPCTIRVVERVRSGGVPRPRGAGSFAQRLMEHERAGTRLELGIAPSAAGPQSPTGRLEAVARDHVVMTDAGGDTLLLPLAVIAWARPG